MTSGIGERVQRVQLLREPAPSGHARGEAVLRAGLSDIAAIRSWATAAEAHLVRELDAVSSFPEAVIAEATRATTNAATKTRERADTLLAAPAFDEALGQGTIVSEHLDELSRAARRLDNEAQRAELFDRADDLLSDAERSTIGQFRRTLAHAVRAIQRDDGVERLARQRRATTMSTWVDDDGMWSLRANFDPLTGLRLGKAIDRMLATLFAEAVPEHCPIARRRRSPGLRSRDRRRGRRAQRSFDPRSWATRPRTNIAPRQPSATPSDLRDVQHVLDPGMRGALRSVQDAPHRMVVERWPHDLSNLLPVCVIHHHKIHDDGWIVTIGDHRRLEVDLPDGTIMTTGQPARDAG